jgi:hypothetical protein
MGGAVWFQFVCLRNQVEIRQHGVALAAFGFGERFVSVGELFVFFGAMADVFEGWRRNERSQVVEVSFFAAHIITLRVLVATTDDVFVVDFCHHRREVDARKSVSRPTLFRRKIFLYHLRRQFFTPLDEGGVVGTLQPLLHFFDKFLGAFFDGGGDGEIVEGEPEFRASVPHVKETLSLVLWHEVYNCLSSGGIDVAGGEVALCERSRGALCSLLQKFVTSAVEASGCHRERYGGFRHVPDLTADSWLTSVKVFFQSS